MKQTICQLINAYRNEILEVEELQPERAAEILIKLAAIFGNVNDEIRRTSMVYNMVLAVKLKQEKTAASAKILSEITQEYSDMKEVLDKKVELLEIIRSLKYYLRAKSEEYPEGTSSM